MPHVTRELGRLSAATPASLLDQGKALLQQGVAIAKSGDPGKILREGTALVAQATNTVRDAAALAQDLQRDPIPVVVKRLQFRTVLTPPVDMTGAQVRDFIKEPTPPQGPAWKVMGRLLKPTLEVDTIAGSYKLAPFGQATQADWIATRNKAILVGSAVVVGLFGLGFVVGRVTKRAK